MSMITHNIHKKLRLWTLQLNRTVGSQVEPQILIILVALVILLVQFFIFLALSSQTIYCQLPNTRILYQSQNLPNYEKLPTIYVITPTYDRYVQKAELIRLSHTFMLVPNLHWIIVEDSEWSTDVVSKLVRRLKNQFNFHAITHLHAPTPANFKLKKGQPSWTHPKGVWQRNKALDWLRENLIDLDRDGVIYFADDDNTYDLELFNEMRYTRKVSVWPVGFVGGLLVERPIAKSSKIQSFNSMWESKRPFPLDMAGFAIGMHLFINHLNVSFSADQKVGYLESHFLNQLIKSWDELEPKADGCSKVLVWHTRTREPVLHEEKKLEKPSHSDIEW